MASTTGCNKGLVLWKTIPLVYCANTSTFGEWECYLAGKKLVRHDDGT